MSKTTIAVLVAAIFLSGCYNEPKTFTSFDLKDVKGLEDCSYYSFAPGKYQSPIRVLRCPGSQTSTTYKVGKQTYSTVVIDGVEYHKKD